MCRRQCLSLRTIGQRSCFGRHELFSSFDENSGSLASTFPTLLEKHDPSYLTADPTDKLNQSILTYQAYDSMNHDIVPKEWNGEIGGGILRYVLTIVPEKSDSELGQKIFEKSMAALAIPKRPQYRCFLLSKNEPEDGDFAKLIDLYADEQNYEKYVAEQAQLFLEKIRVDNPGKEVRLECELTHLVGNMCWRNHGDFIIVTTYDKSVADGYKLDIRPEEYPLRAKFLGKDWLSKTMTALEIRRILIDRAKTIYSDLIPQWTFSQFANCDFDDISNSSAHPVSQIMSRY